MDTLFVLDGNKQVIDILSNNGSSPSSPFFDDIYTQELDSGAESYEFSTLSNGRTAYTLEVGNYILFKYDGKYKLFQIMETVDEHSEGKKLLTCYCEMAGMELLNDYCEPFSLEGNFITFLNTILQNTNWSVGRYSESLITNIQNVSTSEYENIYKLIQGNLATYGGVEIEFRVEFIGNQLVGQYIDCYAPEARGNRTFKRFEYGEDIKGITRNRNIEELATAVIGIGKDNLSFKDISWKKTNGKPCDKPLQQDFVADEEANDLWNNNGKYIKTVYKCDAETAEDLLQQSWDYLQEVKQPKFDYEVDLALVIDDYEDIKIGDTNYVLDFDYNPPILLEARVGKLELSFSDPRNNKCTLSNYKELVSMLVPYTSPELVNNMINSKFPIGGKDIAQGAIGEGHINVTYYQAIKADIVSAALVEAGTIIADKADIEDLRATNAEIENLKADNANINTLVANKANITDLTATNANVTNLTAKVGSIETLVNGNLTSDNIQSLHITSENTTIDNAVIKDAMIDTVSANKINTGTINTNNVVVQSEDGGILMSGSTQQFKDKNGKIRIQIGRDAQNNFTFALFSQDGAGILLDETGIKSGAVPDGLIVNDMISDTANISGGKIDITSLFSEMNDSTSTLKSSKVYFDDSGQTLQVAFNTLKSRVDTISQVTVDGDLSSVIEQVNTNTTNLEIALGKIETLITNTTITKENGAVVQLKDAYNSTVTTVNGHTTKIGSLETNYNTLNGTVSSVSSKQSTLENNLDSFKTTVSNTYTTKSDFNTAKNDINNKFNNYSTTTQMNSAISEMADNINLSVSNTYATKGEINDMKFGGKNLLRYTDFSTDVTNKYSTNNGGVITIGAYTFGNNSDDDSFIRNQKILRHGCDIATAIAAGATYSMFKLKDNVILKANTEYTMSVYMYIGGNTSKASFAIYPVKTDGSLGTLCGSSEKVNDYSGKFIKLVKTFTTNAEATEFSIRYYNTFKDTLTTGESVIYIFNPMLVEGNREMAWSEAPEDVLEKAGASTDSKLENYSTTSEMNSAINIKADSVLTTVSKTYATQASLKTTDDKFKNYSTTTQMNSAINAKADSITSTVSATYATKTDVNDKFTNYSTTTQMNSAIEQSKTGILSTVSNTYATKASVKDVDDKFVNYSTTTEMNSAINQKASDITSTVSKTYTTKEEFNGMVIGGRNLIKHTKYLEDAYVNNEWERQDTGTEGFKKLNIETTTTGWVETSIPLYPAATTLTREVTVSFEYIESVDGLLVFNFGAYASGSRVTELSNKVVTTSFTSLGYRNGWKYASFTFSPNNLNSYTFDEYRVLFKKANGKTGRIQIRKMKLEMGTKATDWSEAPEDVENSISVVKQEADKISWIVKTGDTASTMTLTDRVYSLVSDNINLTASHINLHGYVTANNNFKINTNGSIEAVNGKFSGTITGSTLATSPVDNKYVRVKTSDYAVVNNGKTVISMGLRSIGSGTEVETTTNTPAIYLGADGMNISGGNSYGGKTGRYYGRIVAYNNENYISDENNVLYNKPYLDINFNTKYDNTVSGNPAASQIKMAASGEMYLSPISTLEVRTSFVDGVIGNGDSEYLIAKFASANNSYYPSSIQTSAITNHRNGNGLILADRYYAADGVGYNNGTFEQGKAYWTAVQIDTGTASDGGVLRYVRPLADNATYLGTSNLRWKAVYAANGTVQTSDRRAKENISYITNVTNILADTNSSYSSDDIYNYIKEIPFATYNLIDDPDNNIGFILQDLIQINPDITQDLLLNDIVIEKGHEDEDIPLMGYKQGNFLNMLGLALQKAIIKIEELENRLNDR